MDGKSSRNKVSIGASSLILIFIVLCMATFGLLSLSSAQGDLKLARRNADAVKGYYEADNKGQQWLKGVDEVLMEEMGKGQDDSVFIFDEPTIGLHPLDVQTLLQVFETLVQNGATVLVIEHDLDVMRNADYIIDMGPGGGEAGGRIVAVGTPEQIRENAESVTGQYL